MEFCLIVKYETGECAYLTNKPDLHEALSEFVDNLKQQQASLSFKCYSLPKILGAKLVKVIG